MGKNEKQREYFLFFKSFQDVITDLDDAAQLQLYRAIAKYGLYGEEPTLTGIAATLWKAFFPTMRNNRKNYENGLKGGAPKGNTNAKKWVKPTLEDVEAYCTAKGYKINPDAFFNRYCATDWEDARKKYKSWQDAADKWEESER